MTEKEKLFELILNSKRNQAKKYIDSLYSLENVKYADALLMVSLIKVNRELENSLPSYFIEEDYIIDMLQQKNTFLLIDRMCDEAQEHKNSNSERMFKKAVSYIDNNFTDSFLYASGIAEHIGVSQSTLTKLFEKHMGITPFDYIAQKRINKSKELLILGESVSKTAILSGFSSPEAFIRTFKKLERATPGQFKNKKE